jgi:hypothetical protein
VADLRDERSAEASDALIDAFRALDIPVETVADAVILPDGSALRVNVAAVARPDLVGRLLAATSAVEDHLLVADQVPEASRTVLDGAGWAWLDRRGHLRMRHGSYWIDADVPPLPRMRSTPPSERLTGSIAVGVAAAALRASPGALTGVRPTARLLEASPAATSDAIAGMRDAGLLTRDLRSVDPELFWAVAARYPTTQTGVHGSLPPDIVDVVVVGTRAAAALHVMPATADYPLELLARDEAAARKALRSIQRTKRARPTFAVRIATAPSSYLVSDPLEQEIEGIPLAHPQTIAMSLAADAGRGSEVLAGWNHAARVW